MGLVEDAGRETTTVDARTTALTGPPVSEQSKLLNTWRRAAAALREADDPEAELEAVLAALSLDAGAAKLRGRAVTLLKGLGSMAEAERRRERLQSTDAAGDPEPLDRPGLRRRETAALRHLLDGSAPDAERIARQLVAEGPHRPSGWFLWRGALEAQGRDTAAMRRLWLAMTGDDETLVPCAMRRRLSAKGVVFDPAEHFTLRPMRGVLDEVATPAELRAGENVFWTIDPGGEAVSIDVGIDCGQGQPAVIRHSSAPKFVAAVQGAMVIDKGLALTEDGEFLAELHPPYRPSKYFAVASDGGLRFETAHYADGALPVRVLQGPAILLEGPCDNSFGDWMINFAPRVALAEAAGLTAPYLVRHSLEPWALEVLAAIGVHESRIVRHPPGSALLVPKLYVPSWSSPHKLAPMRGLFDVFRRAAQPAMRADADRVYLSRLGVATRSLANEAEIIELFAARRFAILDPLGLPAAELRERLAGAACVAGAYGSAFLNLAFRRPGASSLMMVPPHLPWLLDEGACWHAHMGHRLAHVFGDMPDGPHGVLTPWRMPLDRMERALDAFLAEAGAV